MRECPNCKTMLEDDELFCHECGTKQEIEDSVVPNEETAPVEKECIHCGETIEEDSAFCPYCGKSQVVEKVKEPKPEVEKGPAAEENTEPKQEDNPAPEKNAEPEETPVQEAPEERPHYDWEDEPKSKKWIWILLVVLLAGAGAWYFLSQNGYSFDGGGTVAEAVDSTPIDEPDVIDEYEEITPTSARGFLEYFYKSEYGDEGFIEQNVTANVLNKLKHDYDYDCETGNCLATWVFTAYPAGADLELEEGPVISETQVDGKFKVDFKYSGYDGEQKHYHTNTVFLTVTEIDGRYLISDYEVQLNGVKDDDTSEEQTSIPHVSGNELSIRKLTEKGYCSS